MQYEATKPFIAFGKTAEPGDIVWLTDEQADALRAEGCVHEVKVERPVEKKPQAAAEVKAEPQSSSQPAQASRKRTLRSRVRKLISS